MPGPATAASLALRLSTVTINPLTAHSPQNAGAYRVSSNAMVEIRKEIDPANGVSAFSPHGEVQSGDLLAYIKGLGYENRTSLVLWDFRDATWSGIPGDRLLSGYRESAKHAPREQYVAFVFAKNVDYGIGRMLQSYADLYPSRSHINIFREYEDAVAWLLEDKDKDKYKD